MKSPVGMEEIETGSSSEDCYQLVKAYMFMPGRKTVLEEICGYSKERTLWI